MFPFKSASNCSIVCPSTPAAPLLDLTALYASYTRRFSIVNGLSVVSVDVILSPVVSLNTTNCRTEQEAEALKAELRARLAECHLELHPTKTKIVYCRDGKRKGTY